MKNRRGPAFFFLAALLFLVLGLWWTSSENSISVRGQRSLGSVEDQTIRDQLVNRHLLMTNKKIELEQEKARLELMTQTPDIGEGVIARPDPRFRTSVDQSVDRNEHNSVRDLQRTPDLNLVSPDTVIQSELADQQKQIQEQVAAREEYIRQYKANARAAGYEIELDENLNIKRMRPLAPGARGSSGEGSSAR